MVAEAVGLMVAEAMVLMVAEMFLEGSGMVDN